MANICIIFKIPVKALICSMAFFLYQYSMSYRSTDQYSVLVGIYDFNRVTAVLIKIKVCFAKLLSEQQFQYNICAFLKNSCGGFMFMLIL